jgi:hypothetical protein
MKVPLETTTVREMLGKSGECLLCDLEEKAESQLVHYFLGNSVMQPQIRVKVNRSGFPTKPSGLQGVLFSPPGGGS